ncbi:MAG: bifunctional anthranilate synthase component II/anthranilate phosphoribosyltransferase [Eubacteriales bacterium]|nr:bifunctional anthranilate synthase component II/anthranilate phosphoribosyltransferase [Eubacteriales bacterium]
MILLIDNYDSFSYNLYQMIGSVNPDIRVVRNDELTAEQIEALRPAAIILSPGPGRPRDAGRCIEIVQRLGSRIPILGVCLGHQAICEAFGGTVTYAKKLMHGKQSTVQLNVKSPLFAGLPEETKAARYHSLAAAGEDFPDCLEVTARTEDGEIMALQHRVWPVFGLQFHPESILTPLGRQMLVNFLQLADAKKENGEMIKEAIVKLANRENLDYRTAEGAMDEIMGGQATPVQMSAFLTAMAMKGETIEEITACAAGMRKHCVRLLHERDVLEIVGTGGDHSNSFNISTTSSLVVSAAGVPVAKHGNRAASSKSGAADVLEALGVKISIDPEKSARVLDRIGLCFLFAQNYHLSMKYVAPVRKELGIRTIFNILGPLTNPAGANMELMGVYDEGLVEPLARVLANLGVKRAMVVYGQDGLDEISMSAPTSVCEVKDGQFSSYVITPEQFGLARCRKEELAGGSPAENAQIALDILRGQNGPRRDAVLLNSAAALHIAKGISLEEALDLARETIDSGRALSQLEDFVRLTNETEERQ